MGQKNTSPEKLAAQWLSLDREAKRIKLAKRSLELILKPFLSSQPNCRAHGLLLVESESERLKLKSAREKLSAAVLAKLKPFISKTKSSYIRSTDCVDVMEEEAP